MKRINSKDVAYAAGVSQATVSQIYNNSGQISDATRERVLRVASEMGYDYRSAKKVRKDSPAFIGVIVPNLFNPVHVASLEMIEQQAALRNMGTVVYNLTIPDRVPFYNWLMEHDKICAVLFTFTPSDPEIVNRLPERLPVVLLGEKDDTIHRDTLSLNSCDAGKLLVEHLYSIGHRDIAFLSSMTGDYSRATERRLTGVRSAMQQLAIEDHLICVFGEDATPPNNFEAYVHNGMRLAQRTLANSPEDTAIIGVDDMTCFGAYMYAQTLGMSKRITICSFDDTVLSRICNFTSIDHGFYMRVCVALDIVQQRLGKEDSNIPPHKSESQPYLVVRPG